MLVLSTWSFPKNRGAVQVIVGANEEGEGP